MNRIGAQEPDEIPFLAGQAIAILEELSHSAAEQVRHRDQVAGANFHDATFPAVNGRLIPAHGFGQFRLGHAGGLARLPDTQARARWG